jgi:TetR/AcrR family transcriptional regulator, cholesterol catabolism regulator
MAVGRVRARDATLRRREAIVATATSLFTEKGYHETSLGDIADQIGFTKPAIYYYFDSKEDILFSIVENIVESGLERIRLIARRGGSPSERLRDLLAENTRVILENIEANTVFYNSRGLLSADREEGIREREREYTQVVRDLYAEGVAAGEFMDLDPAVATATLLGASIWSYQWFDPRGRLSRDTVANDVADLLMNGFRISAPPSAEGSDRA